MIEWICDKAQTLKEFTENNCPQASFAWAYLLRNKEIKVNGKKIGEDIFLSVGDKVQYYLTKKQEEIPAFFVVYEDENILIADKESGVNSEAVFAQLNQKDGGRYAFIHRLDRNTRGLLAFAKTEKAEEELLLAFQKRRVTKLYHALCLGKPPVREATVEGYLVKDDEKSLVRIFNKPRAGAEKIITAYRTVEERAGETKLEVELHTGKTHQIRAHLAYIGCPIVGDMKYGNTAENKKRNRSRQALVAKSLTFFFEGELSYLNGKTFVSKFEV